MRYIDGRSRLVTCGSKALTPTQRRYATIELECLAVQYAIDKCSFYLKGGPEFTVATDHKPLERIFKKDLFEIPNPCLPRLREKLVEFSFIVQCVPEKTHHIADTLSRAPLFRPEETEDMRIDTARACLATTPGMANELDTILNAVDADYIKLKHDILTSTETSVYTRQLRSVFSHLSIDEDLAYIDAKRILLPIAAVQNILALAHTTHSGISKTYKLCRFMYFWPGMFNDPCRRIRGLLSLLRPT